MSNTAPKPFVFILMPFSKQFDDVYQLGIKPACINSGTYAERVDEQLFNESILDRIYNQIAKADIIISDMTGRNPNVFYETGYAHALNKPVILLTSNSEDIPFDLKHFPHVIYEGSITNLIPEIEKRVKHIINQPKKHILSEKTIGFYINGIELLGDTIIDYETKNEKVHQLYLKIDAHNLVKSIIKTQHFQVGIETSNIFLHSVAGTLNEKMKTVNTIKQSKHCNLHLLDDSFTVLPGAWVTKHVTLYTENKKNLKIGDEVTIKIQIFTEDGVFEYPFLIKIKSKAEK